MSKSSNVIVAPATKIQVVDNRLAWKGCGNDCGECRICLMEDESINVLFQEIWEMKLELRKERRRAAEEVEKIQVWVLGALSPQDFIHYEDMEDFDDVPF